MIEISKRSEERTTMRFDKVMSLGKELFKNNLIENIIKYMYVDNKPWNEFYHNSHHLMAVILKSNELARSIHMSDEEKKLLFIAAMFHDYDHSYGYSNDYINVCTSVNAFNKKLKNNGYNNILNLTQKQIDIICAAIMCTVYPFRMQPVNDIEICLRDADLMMSLEEDADDFAMGLTAEFKNSGTNLIVTKEEMLKFARSQVFCTAAALSEVSVGF